MTPEEMTLTIAIEEIRSIASALDIDLPSDAGYVERLSVVADFLDSFGNALKEGMSGLTEKLEQGV